MEYLFVVNLRE